MSDTNQLSQFNKLHSLRPSRRSCVAGSALVEAVVASVVLAIVFLGSVEALIMANGNAAKSRLTTNARVIVQRNIDQASGVPFTSASVPAILALTPSEGVVYDEDGNGDGLANVVVQSAGGSTVVSGVLTRTVVAVLNPEGADIRKITFSLKYTYSKFPEVTTEMTTVRAQD